MHPSCDFLQNEISKVQKGVFNAANDRESCPVKGEIKELAWQLNSPSGQTSDSIRVPPLPSQS